MPVHSRHATQTPPAPRGEAKRDTLPAIGKAALGKCPACGEGRLYDKYLKVTHTCGSCAAELHHQEADDAPAYIVMFIVGHIVIGLVLYVETTFGWPTWLHAAVWTPTILAMSLLLLPPVKGALVAVQWANRMHGFGEPSKAP